MGDYYGGEGGGGSYSLTEATLSFSFLLSFQLGSILKGKSMLLWGGGRGANSNFKSRPYFERVTCMSFKEAKVETQVSLKPVLRGGAALQRNIIVHERINEIESASFISFICALLPEDLLSDG